MKKSLSKDKKLIVVLRIEPGCLGPSGKDRIDDFCRFAQEKAQSLNSHFLYWEIVPRHDKALPEMQYRIVDKTLSREQAAKYLEMFEADIDEFESDLQDRLGMLIDQFLGQ